MGERRHKPDMHRRRRILFLLIHLHAVVFLDFERMERILVNEKKKSRNATQHMEYKVEA